MFLLKQKTAYERRISDWSSDVCSSDLIEIAGYQHGFTLRHQPLDALNQRADLPRTPAREKPQMHDQAMHRYALDFDQRMQQPALLQLVVGNILIFVLQYGVAR